MDSSENKIIGIIPARFASTRFPGKPLAIINGKTMIERVYTQASMCGRLHKVIVATDDARIADHVRAFGGVAELTSPHHQTGTERLAEIIQLLEEKGEYFDIAINIQGDEPFIQPSQIEKVVDIFGNPDARIATLVKQLSNDTDLNNPNVVKAVVNHAGKALYFSRSPIPYVRNKPNSEDKNQTSYFKHIGIYGYRVETLKKLVLLTPAPLEIAESLEQLRWLYHGFDIFVQTTDIETIGIDTPEDLSKLINITC